MGHFHPFSIAMLNYQRVIHWSTISGSWMGKLLRSCCQSEGFSSQIICPSCNGLETGKKPWRARRAPVVSVVSPKDCLFFFGNCNCATGHLVPNYCWPHASKRIYCTYLIVFWGQQTCWLYTKPLLRWSASPTVVKYTLSKLNMRAANWAPINDYWFISSVFTGWIAPVCWYCCRPVSWIRPNFTS